MNIDGQTALGELLQVRHALKLLLDGVSCISSRLQIVWQPHRGSVGDDHLRHDHDWDHSWDGSGLCLRLFSHILNLQLMNIIILDYEFFDEKSRVLD